MTLVSRNAALLGLATLTLLGLTAQASQAQALLTDTTVGTTTFVVPNGVTLLAVQLYGAGGGGSGGFGGGSGALVMGDLSVTPDETLTLLVGGGGFGGGF